MGRQLSGSVCRLIPVAADMGLSLLRWSQHLQPAAWGAALGTEKCTETLLTAMKTCLEDSPL